MIALVTAYHDPTTLGLKGLTLGLLETSCFVFLILVLFQAPIGDYLMPPKDVSGK